MTKKLEQLGVDNKERIRIARNIANMLARKHGLDSGEQSDFLYLVDNFVLNNGEGLVSMDIDGHSSTTLREWLAGEDKNYVTLPDERTTWEKKQQVAYEEYEKKADPNQHEEGSRERNLVRGVKRLSLWNDFISELNS